MAETTHISWADATFNPWIGCTKVSPACDGCYAEHLMANRHKRVVWGGERSRTSESYWRGPLNWNRKAIADGTRPFVFCSSLADVFDNQVPAEWRADLFALIRQTPALVWLLLTKRPQNIIAMCDAAGGPPPNAALGTTIEDQKRAIMNGPALLRAGAALDPLFLFYSCEPLLEIIEPPMELDGTKIGWVITGGETTQGAHKSRPTHRSAYEWLQQYAFDHKAVFHHKQNGEYLPCYRGDPGAELVMPFVGDPVPNRGYPPPMYMRRVGKAAAGRDLNGVIYDARPEVRR